MLKVSKNNSPVLVWWPVEIEVPGDDGKGEAVRIRVRYRLLRRSEMAEALERAGKPADSAEAARVDAWLLDHIADWEGVTDAETGRPLAFTPDNFAALADIPYVRLAIDRGLWEASSGAPVKNSKAGPGG